MRAMASQIIGNLSVFPTYHLFNDKENIKASHYLLCEGNSPMVGVAPRKGPVIGNAGNCSLYYVIIRLRRKIVHIDDLVQDCSNSIANALELLQPSICIID